MTTSTMKNKSILPQNKAFKIVLSLFVILTIWELLALVINDDFFLPGVFKTGKVLVNIIASKTFFEVIFTAFLRVLRGLILGIALGIIIAALCHRSDIVNTVLSPIISIMKATPVACIIVLLWIRLNYTEIAIFVVVLMVTPIVWQNVYDGLKTVDSSLLEVTEVFELSKAERLKVLVIPSILTYLLPAIVKQQLRC